MSGGSQHNPNGRQAQLGAGWSPLQLQVANFLARAPQAHMSERGVTWHTPTPPPHLYHVPAPSPPDPLQAMKASSNSVFRHTGTPPELYRHTPTPPDKHLMRHTPSPGDVKSGPPIPPAELYQHLAPGRDKLVRPDDLLAYARGVDLSVGGARSANGSASAPAAAPALSVRDAPTINSLIARAQPRAGHARVDALLERLSSPGVGGAVAPVSPHSVIVHHTPTPTPSPVSSNEDSTDSCGAPPGSKRKRKPERTIRVPSVPPIPPLVPPAVSPAPPQSPHTHTQSPARNTPTHTIPVENGETHNGQVKSEEKDEDKICEPEDNKNGETHNGQVKEEEKDKIDEPEDAKMDMELDTPLPEPKILENKNLSPEPPVRRKERANSAETIDDIAAMIASDKPQAIGAPLDLGPGAEADAEPHTPTTIDKLKSVLSSPRASDAKEEQAQQPEEPKKSPPKTEEKEKEKPPEAVVESAAAPKRRSPRTSNSESTNVPVESPSEGRPAEPEAEAPGAEPASASFVEVENQLEKMFAGIEEETPMESNEAEESNKPKKRRKSAPTKGETKPGRRSVRASTGDRRKGGKKKGVGKVKKQKEAVKDAYAYDSGSNASSSRSRGPYIQIRGPRDSPLSVSVINAATGEDEAEASTARRKGPEEFRNGLRKRGLHASTLGLRYDATTPDATWLCAFCEKGPHAAGLGDLFGPYTVDTDCEEYRVLDEATRRRYSNAPSPNEVWFHEACAVWAPGLVACGARLWGLAGAVWAARGAKCAHCQKAGAGVACHARGCRARTHVPCAANLWVLHEAEFKASCPRHA